MHIITNEKLAKKNGETRTSWKHVKIIKTGENITLVKRRTWITKTCETRRNIRNMSKKGEHLDIGKRSEKKGERENWKLENKLETKENIINIGKRKTWKQEKTKENMIKLENGKCGEKRGKERRKIKRGTVITTKNKTTEKHWRITDGK